MMTWHEKVNKNKRAPWGCSPCVQGLGVGEGQITVRNASKVINKRMVIVKLTEEINLHYLLVKFLRNIPVNKN